MLEFYTSKRIAACNVTTVAAGTEWDNRKISGPSIELSDATRGLRERRCCIGDGDSFLRFFSFAAAPQGL